MNDLGLFFLYLGCKPSIEYKSCECSFEQALSMAKSWANEEKQIVEIYEFQGYQSVYVESINHDKK